MESSGQNLSGKGSFMESAWGNLRNALIGCSAALLFGLAVLMMSILSVGKSAAAGAVVAAAKEPVTVKVVYYLPYPGILPDSPLYVVKAIRDRVQLVLTFDEAQKAGKELLYADKRIGAAEALASGGKIDLAVSTATKAEKYLESAINRVKKLSGSGRDVKSMRMTLQKAVAKHREILESRPEFDPALKINNSLTVE